MNNVSQPNFNYFTNFLQNSQGILNVVVPIIISLAVIVFLWGILWYMRAGTDEGKRAEGRWLMFYGIIAIFVMVSVWGLVNFLQYLTGVDQGRVSSGPELPGQHAGAPQQNNGWQYYNSVNPY